MSSLDLPVRLAILAAIRVALAQESGNTIITGRQLGCAIVEHCGGTRPRPERRGAAS